MPTSLTAWNPERAVCLLGSRLMTLQKGERKSRGRCTRCCCFLKRTKWRNTHSYVDLHMQSQNKETDTKLRPVAWRRRVPYWPKAPLFDTKYDLLLMWVCSTGFKKGGVRSKRSTWRSRISLLLMAMDPQLLNCNNHNVTVIIIKSLMMVP